MTWKRSAKCGLLVILLLVGSYGYQLCKSLPLRAVTGTRLLLNRIYFEEEECTGSGSALSPLCVTLPASDYRAKHIQTILKAGNGDHLKVGVLGVGRSDTGVLVLAEAGCREGVGMSADASANTEVTILVGARAGLRGNTPPCVDLILAVPRPLRLERLLPVVAQLGVGRVRYTNWLSCYYPSSAAPACPSPTLVLTTLTLLHSSCSWTPKRLRRTTSAATSFGDRKPSVLDLWKDWSSPTWTAMCHLCWFGGACTSSCQRSWTSCSPWMSTRVCSRTQPRRVDL